ncbi:MAG: hypothetical protein V7K77_00585 [Nostoc sp.]|uniref:hypothetical protein n=1 Tax=Nostoc sp. TaxID=1180 RepID=UPI002FF911B3
MLRFSLDFSQVRNPRGVGGVGGWGRSLTPHTPHTPHTPLPLKPTLCVRNPGSLFIIWNDQNSFMILYESIFEIILGLLPKYSQADSGT